MDDVRADPRYLSCSIDTKCKIVVPIYANGKVIGEIDIDSHTPAAFTDSDRLFLEEVAQIVGGVYSKPALTTMSGPRLPREDSCICISK